MSRMKPMLFNEQMVRAIRKNEKTATRRLVNMCAAEKALKSPFRKEHPELSDEMVIAKLCTPPCEEGDILYVRETWTFLHCVDCAAGSRGPCFTAPVVHEDKESTGEGCYFYRESFTDPERMVWRPSIHMPKAAARLFQKVKEVRVERLQDITVEQIRKEGIRLTAREEECHCQWAFPGCRLMDCSNRAAYLPAMYVSKFAQLWDSTIREDRYLEDSFEANPWVWVIEFEACDKPEEGREDGK